MKELIAKSIAEYDQKNQIVFIALKYQGDDICEIGCLSVDPETLKQKESEHEYIKLPNNSKGEEFCYSRKLFYNALHEKVWIYHNTDIDSLMKLFRNLGAQSPKAKCKIDTINWYNENFEGKINDMSLEGIYEHYEGEILEPSDQRTALVDCFTHLEVLKVSLGVKRLNDKLAKAYEEMLKERS